jgi:hypothetical protein
MALGLNTNTNAEIFPHIRYDARAGRLFRNDREQQPDGKWESKNTDITSPAPLMLMDLAQIEVGWIAFTGGAPDFHMVRFGEPLPQQPSKEHRQGFRIRVYAPKLLGGLREFSATARVVIAAMDALHNQFEAAPESGQRLLPLVMLAGTTPVVSKAPQGQTTNYAPIFEITKWLPRPDDMPLGAVPRIAAPASAAPQAAAPIAAAPARHVPAPLAAPPPEMATHDTEF